MRLHQVWPDSYKPRWCVLVPASRYFPGPPGCPSRVRAGGRWWRGDSTAPCTWRFRPVDHGRSLQAGHVCIFTQKGPVKTFFVKTASVRLVLNKLNNSRIKKCLVLQNSRNEVCSKSTKKKNGKLLQKSGKYEFKHLYSLMVALCIFVCATLCKLFSLSVASTKQKLTVKSRLEPWSSAVGRPWRGWSWRAKPVCYSGTCRSASSRTPAVRKHTHFMQRWTQTEHKIRPVNLDRVVLFCFVEHFFHSSGTQTTKMFK